MTNIQQLVLVKMQALSLNQQESVLQFIEDISHPQSKEDIEELLTEGLDSIDRGEGIETTEAWWEQERNFLIERQNTSTSN